LALAVVISFAWYLLLTALTASLRRGCGVVIGVSWLAALILPGIASIQVSSGSALASAIVMTARTIDTFNPVAYLMHVDMTRGGMIVSQVTRGPSLFATTETTGTLIGIILCILYIAAALVQWRRVEA
jgi:hypothetical protein